MRLGRAAVRALGGVGHTVVIGRDTRVSGRMLESALVAGLLAEGAEVMLAGVIPTPGVAYLTEELDVEAGVVISASHNPYSDNGIKFFGPGGVKLPDATEKAIESQFEDLSGAGGGPIGHANVVGDAEERYIEHLLSCVNSPLDGLKVALDCANGAAYRVCPSVFERLGASVEVICAEPDGENINRECGSTHPGRLIDLVRSWKADLGFALDGDADRCICVDETGEIRDGDYIMAIAARYLKDRSLLEPPVVVSTVMSNLGFYHALGEMGIESVQVQVGDRYVMEAMLSGGAVLGGEQSGHIIFREHSSTGDGTLTALLVSAIVKDEGMTLSGLAGPMRKYPQVLLNVRSKSGRRLEPGMRVWELVRAREEELGSEGRILVRPSGTEPVERVMVEATSEEMAQGLAREIADAILHELEH